MSLKTCALVGVPMQSGTRVRGCLMGPDAYRTAGLAETVASLGYDVQDLGNVTPVPTQVAPHSNARLHDLAGVVGWAKALEQKAYEAAGQVDLPIFMGGDHGLSIGTVPGIARRAAEQDKPLFVLWLDAHPDIHSPDSTESGNLHGTPVGYFTGQAGFEGVYPPLAHSVPGAQVTMVGLRSVDEAERNALKQAGIDVHDMRDIDEHGVAAPIKAFLARAEAAGGRVHVSLDVDFLDPGLAPAVGTTVPGGATFREAHLIMELLCDSELVGSLDLVELNPFLDDRGKTARLMVDLTASLLGRTVLDRPTRSY